MCVRFVGVRVRAVFAFWGVLWVVCLLHVLCFVAVFGRGEGVFCLSCLRECYVSCVVACVFCVCLVCVFCSYGAVAAVCGLFCFVCCDCSGCV